MGAPLGRTLPAPRRPRSQRGREIELRLDASGEGRAFLDDHLRARHVAGDMPGRTDRDRALRDRIAGELPGDDQRARIDVARDRAALVNLEIAAHLHIALESALDAQRAVAMHTASDTRPAPEDGLGRLGIAVL